MKETKRKIIFLVILCLVMGIIFLGNRLTQNDTKRVNDAAEFTRYAKANGISMTAENYQIFIQEIKK